MAKILVMHTNKFLRMLYVVELAREGFDILLAADGLEAVKEIKESSPDLVVVAVPSTPTPGIAELIAALRERPKLPFIPQATMPVIDSGIWPRDIFARQKYDLTKLITLIREHLEKGMSEKQRSRSLDAVEIACKTLGASGDT
jgi:DNA-binding NtrC family response regulator